jgi:hypothetical protein
MAESQSQNKRRNNQEAKTTSQKKRKDNRGTDKPAKKARPNYDIKRYITCKRWKEQEAEEGKEKEGECQLDKQEGGLN